MSRFSAVGVLLICLVSACSDVANDQRTYVLTTGTTGGTFYPVGVALSTLVSARAEEGFSLTAISSAGSMENIKLLRDNQAQFGLILGTFAAWAYDGVGPISTAPYSQYQRDVAQCGALRITFRFGYRWYCFRSCETERRTVFHRDA